MKYPYVTVYQNETDVVIIFSPISQKEDEWRYRGSSTSFENRWMDGGACGLGSFRSKKEVDKFLKDNNLEKRGTLKLDKYCYSNFTIPNSATLTCVFKKNHKGKHEAVWKKHTANDEPTKRYKWWLSNK